MFIPTLAPVRPGNPGGPGGPESPYRWAKCTTLKNLDIYDGNI